MIQCSSFRKFSVDIVSLHVASGKFKFPHNRYSITLRSQCRWTPDILSYSKFNSKYVLYATDDVRKALTPFSNRGLNRRECYRAQRLSRSVEISPGPVTSWHTLLLSLTRTRTYCSYSSSKPPPSLPPAPNVNLTRVIKKISIRSIDSPILSMTFERPTFGSNYCVLNLQHAS